MNSESTSNDSLTKHISSKRSWESSCLKLCLPSCHPLLYRHEECIYRRVDLQPNQNAYLMFAKSCGLTEVKQRNSSFILHGQKKWISNADSLLKFAFWKMNTKGVFTRGSLCLANAVLWSKFYSGLKLQKKAIISPQSQNGCLLRAKPL